MIENLGHHITNRLGNDLNNLDNVLSTFKHIKVKRNEQQQLELTLTIGGTVCNIVLEDCN